MQPRALNGLERDKQNLVDLGNGESDKFIFNGKTLELPGITPSDSR